MAWLVTTSEIPTDFDDSVHQKQYSRKLDSTILRAKVRTVKSADQRYLPQRGEEGGGRNHCRNTEARFVHHAPNTSLCLSRPSNF